MRLAIALSRSSLEMAESLNFFFIGDCSISLFRSPLSALVLMMGLMQSGSNFTDRIVKYVAKWAERKTKPASLSRGHVILLFLIISLISDQHKQFCCWSSSRSKFCLSCVKCLGCILFNLIKAAIHLPTFACWNDLRCHFILPCLGHKHEAAPFPSSSCPCVTSWLKQTRTIVVRSCFGRAEFSMREFWTKVVLFY